MFVVDRHDTGLLQAFVLEAEHLDRGPLARIQIPFRLRCGVHGNWMPGGGTGVGVRRGRAARRPRPRSSACRYGPRRTSRSALSSPPRST